jgi:NADPH:quinone reductase-like Zn-dependent oxidoreductase
VDMVRSIGADQVIDYTREDFTENRKRYDLILDMIGNHSLSHRRRALTPEGTLVLVGGADEGRWLGPLADPLKAIAVSRFVRHKLRLFLARSNRDDLKWMREHLEDGSVTPVIDRVYPFSDVAEAIRYLEEGHARGKIVLSLAPANTPGPKHGPTRSFP